MIADRTDHARLQFVEGDVIGEAANVHLCVVMTARIVAIDEHTASPAYSRAKRVSREAVSSGSSRASPIKGRPRRIANHPMGWARNRAALQPIAVLIAGPRLAHRSRRLWKGDVTQ